MACEGKKKEKGKKKKEGETGRRGQSSHKKSEKSNLEPPAASHNPAAGLISSPPNTKSDGIVKGRSHQGTITVRTQHSPGTHPPPRQPKRIGHPGTALAATVGPPAGPRPDGSPRAGLGRKGDQSRCEDAARPIR